MGKDRKGRGEKTGDGCGRGKGGEAWEGRRREGAGNLAPMPWPTEKLIFIVIVAEVFNTTELEE